MYLDGAHDRGSRLGKARRAGARADDNGAPGRGAGRRGWVRSRSSAPSSCAAATLPFLRGRHEEAGEDDVRANGKRGAPGKRRAMEPEDDDSDDSDDEGSDDSDDEGSDGSGDGESEGIPEGSSD